MKAALIALLLAAPATAQDRVLALGGSVAEIVYALGEGHRLIARDQTATFPPEVLALPDVGYLRALSAEGVLSVDPDLILAEDDAGPPEAVAALQAAGVNWVHLPDGFSADGVAEKIRLVGAALEVPDKAAALGARVAGELAEARAAADAIPPGDRRRVLFVLSLAGGRIMAAGSGTAADGIIALAGGVNAVEGVAGYKPLTDEAVALARPDVVLMMDRGGDHDATADELFALPALALSPAARDRALVRMDGLLLLGFGPRTGAAALALNAALYPGRE